jgi:hypothetical protein
MTKRKWFFKRGNARLSWETLPEWVKWVAVDEDGEVGGFTSKPDNSGMAYWTTLDGRVLLACVGSECPDWQSLIFERPQPVRFFTTVDANTFADCSVSFELHKPCKPVLPTITVEEWAAIRLLSLGAEYVAKDKNGNVYVYNEEPYIFSTNGWWKVVGEPMRVRLLEDRFASVPWRESLVKYEPPQENFLIKVTCACGEEVLVDDEPIYGVWAKRNYTIPCPNCHANLKIRVRYEAAD